MLRSAIATNGTRGASIPHGLSKIRRKSSFPQSPTPYYCHCSVATSWQHQSQQQQRRRDRNQAQQKNDQRQHWSPTGNGRGLLQRLNGYNSRFYSPNLNPASISLERSTHRLSSPFMDDVKKFTRQKHPLLNNKGFSSDILLDLKLMAFRIRGTIIRQPSLTTISGIHLVRNNGERLLHGNGVRWLTTNSKQGDQDKAKNGDRTVEQSNPESEMKGVEESAVSGEGGTVPEGAQDGSPRRLTALVDSVGPTWKRVQEEWNTGDLLSVYGIVALIGVIAVAPFVVRHMRRSDSTYDDLDPEDPVMDMARIVRDEYLRSSTAFETLSENGEQQERHGSTLGIDSIVAELLKSKQIQDAVTGLVTKVIESPQFKRACQVLLRELWNDLVQDPETLSQVVHLLQYAIQDERIKEAAIQLVMDVVNDEEVLEELTALLQKLGREQKVQAATQSLLVESAHNALNDPEILDHSMEFATDVVGDDVVQRTAGEALYNTLSYAVRPTLSVFLSVMGAGLIVLSVAAFRNAHATEEQMDRALSSTMSFLESGNLVSKIFSIPIQILTSCKNAIVYVVTFPHRVISGLFGMIGRTGTATIDAISKTVHWLVSLPGGISRSILNLLRRGSDAILSTLSDKSRQTWSSIVTSITNSAIGIFVAQVGETVANTYNKVIAFDGITMIVSAWTNVSRKISFSLNKVDDKLNTWGVAVEVFISGILVTIKNVATNGTTTVTNICSSLLDFGVGVGTKSKDIFTKVSNMTTQVSTTMNYSGEQLTDFLNKIMEVITSSFNTITKR